VTPSIGRYLAARALTGGAVALLLAIPASRAPAESAGVVAAAIAVTSIAVAWLGRGGRAARARVLLACSIVLDLAVESALVGATGASRSPFVLLYSLTIAATGLYFGLKGGLSVAAGATVGYWLGILLMRSESGIAPLLTTLFLVLLGLLAGLLGRRAAEQRREVERVRGELERVRLDAEAIVASLTSPLLCIDSEGEIRKANEAAVRLLGLGPDPQGSSLEAAGSPERLQPLLDHVREVFANGEAAVVEIDLQTNDADVPTPVEVIASTVRDRTGRVLGLVLLLQDLTRRKEQESEQARRERLAVIGELSGHLAHEIRNSLKPVVGSIELLAQEIPSYGVAGELTAIILREGEALEKFLSDFLTFSRDKTLQMEEFDLDELLQDEIASVSRHPARVRGVVLRAFSGPPDERVRTDRAAIRDILRNLLVNALEATLEGVVTVRWSGTPGDGIEVCIEDTGIGLKDVDPDALFEAFRTEKPGGTGLGLTIARRLARRLGGDVMLERRVPVGTCARLRIPGCRIPGRAAA